MKSKKNIENKIKKDLIFSAGQNLHDQMLNDVLNKHKKPTKKISFFEIIKMWGVIMTKSPVKLGLAAAIIILTVIIYVMGNQNLPQDTDKLVTSPDKEIVKTTPEPPSIDIPQELVDMSIEQLLIFYTNPESSSYDLELIDKALMYALNKMDSGQLLAMVTGNESTEQGVGPGGGGFGPMQTPKIGGSSAGSGFPVTVDISNYNWIPLYDFLVTEPQNTHIEYEEQDLFVNAQLVGITLNVDDIEQALINRRKRMPEFYREQFRAKVQLEIHDTTDEDLIPKNNVIEVSATIQTTMLRDLKIGERYYIGLIKTQDGFRFLQYMRGVFEVKENDDSDSLEAHFWKFLCDSQDILVSKNKPKQEEVDYWKSLLNSEAYQMALTYMKLIPKEQLPSEAIRDTIVQRLLNENSYDIACEYLSMLPDNQIPAKEIMDVVEKTYNFLESPMQGGYSQIVYSQAVRYNSLRDNEKIVNLLLRSGDKESIKRLVTLLDQDADRGNRSIFKSNTSRILRRYAYYSVQLLIAAEKDNPGNLFLNIYDKYKEHLLIDINYNTTREFANDLLLSILNQVEEPVDEDTYSMITEMIKDPSIYWIYEAESYIKMWKILSTNGDFDIRSYLEKFLANPELSTINIKVPAIINSKKLLSDLQKAARNLLAQLPDSK